MITYSTERLENVALSSFIITGLSGTEAGSIVAIDSEFIPGSENPIQSKAIYSKLESLSNEISTAAHTLDLSIDSEIKGDSNNPVKGRTIWNFCINLSSEITNSFDISVSNNGSNAVKSSGIYTALHDISTLTLTSAYNNDLSLQSNIEKNGTQPVAAGTIWNFVSAVSCDVLSAIPSINLADEVEENGQNAVTSKGIYKALSGISSLIPTDYVKTGENDKNDIFSENDFIGKPVTFDIPVDNGPFIQFNTDSNYHCSVNGIKLTIPNEDDGYGPGGNITTDDLIKIWTSEGYQLSSDLLATRRWIKAWTDNKLQEKLTEQQLSTLTQLVKERQTVIKFNNGAVRYYDWYGTLTKQDLIDADLVRVTDSSSTWAGVEQIRFGTALSQIGEDVSNYRDGLFFACNYLKNIWIPNTIEKIGNFAFANCSNLLFVDLPTNLIEIGTCAFTNCSKITYAVIPKTVKYINGSIFESCASLTSVTFANRTLDEVKTLGTRNGVNTYPWGLQDESIVSTKKIVGYDVQLSSENGISGIYINDKSLYDYFDNHYLKNETSSDSELSIAFNSLSNYYQKNETSSVEELQYAFDNLDVNIDATNLLDKRYGGKISGDIVLDNCGLSVNNGNYIQTSNANFVNNYSAKNAFVQAEEAVSENGESYGPASIGSMGYCIIGVAVDGEENGFKLSGDISKLRALVNNDRMGAGITYPFNKSRTLHGRVLNSVGDISSAHFSFSLDDKSASIAYTIKSIDNNDVVWFNEKLANDVQIYKDKDEEWFIQNWLHDDNALYVAGFPEIGNMIIENFYAQHLEGGSNRIPAKYGHTEGRDNIADVRYTHAEGSHTIAGDMAAHAEGFVTTAHGRFSHAEGRETTANGLNSHAEGYLTIANGQNAHAEGYQTIADADNSHAGGKTAKAYGPHSFAFGNNPYTSISANSGMALGGQVSAIASNTFACGRYSVAEDMASFVWNGMNSWDNYYNSNGEGTFNINPIEGISGFYIGDKSLYSYLSDFATDSGDSEPEHSGDSEPAEPTIINNLSNTFITHQLDNGFIYNDGKTFDESPSAAVFITAGGGNWGFYNGTGNSRFEGKFIKVKPGDIITYQKKPYPVQVPTNPLTSTTVPTGAINYYTTYIRALSIHDFSEITNTAMSNGSKAPLDNSTVTSTDPEVRSSWDGLNGSHQFYRQNALIDSGKWSANYVNSADSTSWNVVRQRVKSDTNNNSVEYLNYAFEVQVKVPENTYLLYVCTKYYNIDQSLLSFKINGYELVKDANNVETSLTENSFNCNSATNQLYSSLTCFNKYGYGISHNGNYLLTHYIPCKYGDQILLSMTCPYKRTDTQYIYGRSIEYFDENFNRIAGSSESTINNGFNASQPLNSDSLDRKCVQLVSPVSVKGCKYVRIGIPMGQQNSDKTYKDTIIQIIPLDKYPAYTIKEPNNFIAFQKNWSQTTDNQQNMTDFEGKQLLFFGDSITRNSIAGNDRPTGSQNHSQYEATLKGYVHYLSESLHSYYVNAGNGGDTAALSSTTSSTRGSLAEKIEKWENESTYSSIITKMGNSDAVFVMIGTNDWAYSWTPFGDASDTTNTSNDNFCGAIRSICSNLHQKFAGKAPIVFLTPIKRVQQSNSIDYTEANSNGKLLSDYCEAIKTICNEYDGIYVIDLYNICKIDPGTKTNHTDVEYLPDGTHPSSLGHKVIAKCILKKLPEIMKAYNNEIDPVDSMIEQ